MTTTAVIMIGNSDDKLTQREWADFVSNVDTWTNNWTRMPDWDAKIHGRWFSAPDNPYQNAAWCIEINEAVLHHVYRILAGLALTYRQDSIAVVTNQPHLVAAAAFQVGTPYAP